MSDKYPWSNLQKAIFNEVKSGTGNVVIEALAGSAKTSSIIESLEYIPFGKSWLLCAFNKRIADELNRQAPSVGGDVKTLHSIGLRSLFKKFPKLKVDDSKCDRITGNVVGKSKRLFDVKKQIKKTVSLCKSYLIDGAEMIDFIMDNHDIDQGEMERSQFIKHVQGILQGCADDTKYVDFDDMIWMPYVHKSPMVKYDYIFIDESQDLSGAQISIALKSCKRNGRVFAAGDKNQAIYSWRGASLNALSNLKSKLDAKSLPLSISYRCPIKVSKEAQKYVPHFEWAPNAPDGIVEYITTSQMAKQAKSGCFILSRTNAPLIGFALEFIRCGVPATIQGRDIGKNLINLIKKSRKDNITQLLYWLDTWKKKEITRLSKKDREFGHIIDKAACLEAIADSCSNISHLKSKILELFEDTDEKDRITLSTIHKAKGLQRDVVFVLNNTFMGNSKEERNLRYVAVTRSAGELYYVT